MKPVKRLEIITSAVALHAVTAVLEEHGVSGYTVHHGLTGKGDRGVLLGDELTGVFASVGIVVAVEPARLEELCADLRPLLTRHGGAGLVSDAEWILH